MKIMKAMAAFFLWLMFPEIDLLEDMRLVRRWKR